MTVEEVRTYLKRLGFTEKRYTDWRDRLGGWDYTYEGTQRFHISAINNRLYVLYPHDDEEKMNKVMLIPTTTDKKLRLAIEDAHKNEIEYQQRKKLEDLEEMQL